MVTVLATFFKNSRAGNSAVRSLIWSKFELIRDIVVILATCKNEEDPQRCYSGHSTKYGFFKHSRAYNSAVRGRIWSKFELIRDVMDVLVTSKNKEDPNKNEGARVATTLNIDFSQSREVTLQSNVGSG